MAGYTQDPGWFGTGQYQLQERSFDDAAARIPGAERYRQVLWQNMEQAGGRAAPQVQAATIATGPQDEARAQQMRVLGGLVDASEGRGGPSVAELQMRQATDRNVRGAVAAANTVRGLGGGAALRQVSQAQAQAGQQAAADSALLRANEIATARQQAMQGATGVRGQDVALASEQASLQQQAGLANQDATLRMQQLNDQAVQTYLGMGMSLAEAQQRAAMDLERLKTDYTVQMNNLGLADYNQARASRQAFLTGALNTGASVGLAIAGIPKPPAVP